jgi:hypothetical protein
VISATCRNDKKLLKY